MRLVYVESLNLKRSIAATIFALTSFAISGSVSVADTSNTAAIDYYLDRSPGRFVEYLSLSESSHQVVGYFEAIHASTAASGQLRTQIYATRRGSVVFFGKYTAERTGGGFTLTAVSDGGEIVQRHFVRASVESVNASVVAFQTTVVRHRITARAVANNAESNGTKVLSVDNAGQLRQAEANVSAAQAELIAARDVANRVCASARKARADANAAIEQPGASFTQNQSRMTAMNVAENADQTEAVAERRVDIAATAVEAAQTEVALLRSRMAARFDRNQALASSGAGGP